MQPEEAVPVRIKLFQELELHPKIFWGIQKYPTPSQLRVTISGIQSSMPTGKTIKSIMGKKKKKLARNDTDG